MRAIVTPDDLKKGDLVDNGWYPAELTAYEEKDADTDGSTNCIFKFKILAPDSAKGVSPTKFFNEKALGFGKELWATLGIPFDKVKGYELTTEAFRSKVGAKLDIYIKRGKSNKGNEFNDIQSFRPTKG